MTEQHNDAHLAVSLMDLTSLNTSDTASDIQQLVNSINPKLGTPAAVCVYSDFVAVSYTHLTLPTSDLV